MKRLASARRGGPNLAHRKLKRYFPAGGTVSRCRWAVNRVGLLVNSCHVAGFSGPFIGFKRPISAPFCRLRECRGERDRRLGG
jgi:hypothetical protein